MNSLSLLEMLLVIAIIGILSVEGIYSVKDAGEMEVREYCKSLNGYLDNLYLESRFRRQEIKVTFDIDKNNIFIAKSNVGNVAATKAKLSNTITPPKNIKIASAKFSTINNQGQTLVFNGSAAPDSSAANNGTVVFEDSKENKKCAIVQSLYGARRIEL